ncbi:hypothetical protein CLOSCI_00574 [[Clostridium] scindens ATCC 35704]|nr:hypothetical protein CLOSCI_00574 [[Clostridium] scindens ATCC 35704]
MLLFSDKISHFIKSVFFGCVLFNRLSHDPAGVFFRERPNLTGFHIKSRKLVVRHGTF